MLSTVVGILVTGLVAQRAAAAPASDAFPIVDLVSLPGTPPRVNRLNLETRDTPGMLLPR